MAPGWRETRGVEPGIVEASATDPGEPPAQRLTVPPDEAHEAAELAAIEAAYAAIRDIAIRMRPRRDGSEIARINFVTPGTPVEVQPDTWRMLQLARRLDDLTDGIFDPCLPTRSGYLGDIEIQHNTPVLICHAPVALELGGIAKGHAIDRAVEKLQEFGCTSGLVNAGGDLRVFGDRAETIFLRQQGSAPGLEEPDSRDRPDEIGRLTDNNFRSADGNPTFRPLTLQNSALAVSDLDAGNRPSEHQGYYTRGRDRDATLRRYAATIAGTATVADALTKCVLLYSDDMAMRVLYELEAGSALSDEARR